MTMTMLRLLRPLPLLVSLVLLALGALPASAEEKGEGGYQKLDNMVITMWDKNGNFHTLVLQMQAYFPQRPQLPKGLGGKISAKIRLLPYEELKKPDSPERIKDLTREVLMEDPGSANVEGIFIQKMMFQ